MIYYFRWRMANQNLKGGITVNCPFCDKEMQQGKLRTRGENYFVPNGCKTPLLYTKKSMGRAGAVLVSPDCFNANGEENWQTAFLCEECRKVIADF